MIIIGQMKLTNGHKIFFPPNLFTCNFPYYKYLNIYIYIYTISVGLEIAYLVVQLA